MRASETLGNSRNVLGDSVVSPADRVDETPFFNCHFHLVMIRFACNETREFQSHSIAMYRDLMKIVRCFSSRSIRINFNVE